MKKQIVIRVEESIKNQLDEYCEKHCVVQTKLLSKIIENFLDESNKNPLNFIQLLNNSNDKEW